MLPLGLLLALLALPGAGAVTVERSFLEGSFVQESLPLGAHSGQFLRALDREELLHVDWDRQETVWRLPGLAHLQGYKAETALGHLAVLRKNLHVLLQRSNRTQHPDVAPSVVVYPKCPVDLGSPNTLICFVDQFFPPVLNITWLKNGEVVSRDVEETVFYPSAEGTFRKFSYLPVVPKPGDIYACKVDHWGLTGSLTKLWYSKALTPIPEMLDNVVCALGLVLGILGILAGTILCFKARQRDEGSCQRGTR